MTPLSFMRKTGRPKGGQTGHAHKDMESIDDDNVLELLTSDTKVMHDHHALICTHIESRRRNGINKIDALQRLCSGNPYTVEEIFVLPSS